MDDEQKQQPPVEIAEESQPTTSTAETPLPESLAADDLNAIEAENLSTADSTDTSPEDAPAKTEEVAADAPTSDQPGPADTATPEEPSEKPQVVVDALAALHKKESGSRRKKFVLIGASAVVVIGVVGVSVVAGLGRLTTPAAVADTSTPTRAVAKMGVAVTLVDGEAQYQSTAGGEWQPLTTSTLLSEKASVRTTDGRVVLTLDDGSAVRLDSQTAVTLTSLVATDIKITQTTGAVYSRVVPSERSYSVQTSDTSYKAMGTAFLTLAIEQEKGVQVYQSSVKVDDLPDAVGEGKQYYKANQDAKKKSAITDIDLDVLLDNKFVNWNLSEDEKTDAFKERLGILKTMKERIAAKLAAKEAEEKMDATAMKLSGTVSDNSFKLSWDTSSVTAPDGFKVVRSSSSATPTFGKDEAVYVSSSAARSYTWKASKNGTYWYRVCAYRASQSTCASYSNAVKLTVSGIDTKDDSDKDTDKVTRGTMTLGVSGAGTAMWSFTGKAIYGYKLVYSKSHNPTYPTRDGDSYIYVEHQGQYSADLNIKKKGTYYVRVCAYTNGTENDACVSYSNEVTYVKH